MTVILVLLCLAIAGRELYLAFERKRSAGAPEIADIRTQLTALKGTRDELEGFRASQRERLEGLTAEQDREKESLRETDARIRSLIAQINDRMVPDVNDRLTRQRDALDRLSREVAGLRGHLVGRLDQAVAASLGADPADVVAGGLTAEPAAARSALTGPYERFAERYGLRVELTDRDRYYLSGRSPRGLERDFIDLVRVLRTTSENGGPPGEVTQEARALLGALRGIGQGGLQVGPLLAVRTNKSLLCGVLTLADLRRPETAGLWDHPVDAIPRLRRLPEGRRCDLTAWPALTRPERSR
ncbi:hypothetical protein [Actinomadura rubrisoli]|uniref:Uncharacterized protein n=1 Tax=Actinomadura rubrisoli TaxID=2530368 RepID=A0A4R5BD14_9ACTN|nr:hypothetical protein [Actinomadura rubrisoli]TDD84081.1 hypothetical protein E1298_20360 [Actinomadura rubrisoli]